MSRTVVSPLERLKILFQVQSAGHNEYKLSVGKALAKMWKEEGWRGFMAGNGTNCIRIVPYSAVQFGSYNLYKRASSPFNLPHSRPSLSNGRYHHKGNGKLVRLTLVAALLREVSRRPFESPRETCVRWHSRYYLGLLHLSARHRANSTIHPIGIVRRA